MTENSIIQKSTTVLKLLPMAISSLLLAAHFLRAQNYGLVALCLMLPLMMPVIKRKWVFIVLRFLLILGAFVWIATAVELSSDRIGLGEPWIRMFLILGSVAGFTFFSAAVLKKVSMQFDLCETSDTATSQAAAFLITAILLGFIQSKVSTPLLLFERFMPGTGWIEIMFLSTYAALITEKMLKAPETNSIRSWIWGLFSFVFFVQLILGLSGLEVFLMSGKLHLPVPALIVAGPLYRGSGYFMLILFSTTLLLLGPAWCSYLCYIGAWDNIASRSKTSMKFQSSVLPSWTRHISLLNLLLISGAALTLRYSGAPASTALWLAILFGLAGVALMIFWSTRTGIMTHCTMYCPMGWLAVILGRISPFRIRLDSTCTECGKCSRVCRYNALSQKDIHRRKPANSCTLCGDCIGSCNQSSIFYSFPGISKLYAKNFFIVLAVSVHTIFLGIARM